MRIYAVRVFVDDWTGAIDFYRSQLGLTPGFVSDELGWAEFDIGGARLAIERVDADAGVEERALVGRFVGVSLEVDDVVETHRTLSAKGVRFDGPPQRQAWGGTLAQVIDPCGNVLTLMGR